MLTENISDLEFLPDWMLAGVVLAEKSYLFSNTAEANNEFFQELADFASNANKPYTLFLALKKTLRSSLPYLSGCSWADLFTLVSFYHKDVLPLAKNVHVLASVLKVDFSLTWAAISAKGTDGLVEFIKFYRSGPQVKEIDEIISEWSSSHTLLSKLKTFTTRNALPSESLETTFGVHKKSASEAATFIKNCNPSLLQLHSLAAILPTGPSRTITSAELAKSLQVAMAL